MNKEIKWYINDKHEFIGLDEEGNEYVLECEDYLGNSHQIYPVQIIKEL